MQVLLCETQSPPQIWKEFVQRQPRKMCQPDSLVFSETQDATAAPRWQRQLQDMVQMWAHGRQYPRQTSVKCLQESWDQAGPQAVVQHTGSHQVHRPVLSYSSFTMLSAGDVADAAQLVPAMGQPLPVTAPCSTVINPHSRQYFTYGFLIGKVAVHSRFNLQQIQRHHQYELGLLLYPRNPAECSHYLPASDCISWCGLV